MRSILSSLVISILVIGLAYVCLCANPAMLNIASSTPKETTYERVLRTGTIRCGYTDWYPLFYIDVKTGEKLGIFYDLMKEVGKRLDVKIIWQEELGWGTVVESVKTHRVDMACTGYWLNPARIKNILPSIPQIYTPLYIWMRQSDDRSIATPDDLNSAQYRVGTADGGAANQVIDARFPKAKILSLSELASTSDLIENLVTGKVDFLIVDAMTLSPYLANNPGKIKNTFPNQPMNLFPTVMMLPPDDMRFKSVIDNVLQNIEYDGTLDAILKKHQMDKGFLRNPPPVMFSE